MVTMNKDEMKKREAGLNIKLIEKGASFKVELRNVFKNNTDAYGYSLIEKGSRITPILYPEPEWHEMDNDELAIYLIMRYEAVKANVPEIDVAKIISRENILTNVYPKMWSEENLPKIINDNLVYEIVHDMVVTFYIRINNSAYPCEMASIKVDHKVCESAEIDPNTILDIAIKNLNQELVIQDLGSMLFGMLNVPEHISLEEFMPNSLMIVATNKSGVNGASVILSDKALNKVATKLNTDKFFICPSSIHEIICVPFAEFTADEIKSIIKACNKEVVNDCDKLTDTLYVYNNGMVTIHEE